MEKIFTEADILKAKDLYLFDGGILYLIDQNGEAYSFCQGRTAWFHKDNFWDYFDSRMMMPYLSVPTKEEAVLMYRKRTNQ